MAEFKDHFSSLAAQYAQARPHYPDDLFDYFASICAGKQRAWDCACGTGQASTALAERFNWVIATDASARQVAEATLHPRIEYRVATAEASGIEPESIDFVGVAQALHWFKVDEFYAEAHRVLRPRGVLAVWTYGIQHVEDPRIDQEVQRFYGDVVGPYWPPERKLVETGYRDLRFPFEEMKPPHFVMKERWPLERLLGYFRSWSATGRYVADRRVDPVTPLEDRLAPLWGDPKQTRLVEWPVAMRVGRRA